MIHKYHVKDKKICIDLVILETKGRLLWKVIYVNINLTPPNYNVKFHD